MPVRLADVATQAGVSEATVSRVLNGKPGVSATRRRAVLAALDRLGYERPLRSRQRSAGLVGLITPELDNPIFPMFAQAIERDLTRHGYTPVLCTQTPGGATEDDYTDLLVERGVAGILCVSGLHADSTASPGRYVRLLHAGVPIVLVNGHMEGVAAPFVSTDDRSATRLAVSHLAALGHTRIGLAVGQRRYVPVIRKVAAFVEVSEELLGRTDAETLVEYSIFSVEGGQAAGAALLNRGCTAVVCGSDLMALGTIRAARARGLAVPRDVSVVGFDDSPLIAFTDPPLTTIRQPVQAMSEAAVRALLEEIAGAPTPKSEFLFQPDLVVRGSTAARHPIAVPSPARGPGSPAHPSRPGGTASPADSDSDAGGWHADRAVMGYPPGWAAPGPPSAAQRAAAGPAAGPTAGPAGAGTSRPATGPTGAGTSRPATGPTAGPTGAGTSRPAAGQAPA